MIVSSCFGRWLLGGAIAAACVIGMARSAGAQTSGSPPRISQDLPESDFLFKRPRGLVSVRGAWLMPSENSDLFDFVQDQLTIDSGDFNSPSFAMDLGYALNPHLDIVGGFDVAKQSVDSEYRDLVDNNLLPIEQQSTLRQNSFTGSIRVALMPRGRAVGRYAWVPARVQPYVGAGGGMVFWEFKQTGDFVDFQDQEVFSDVFTSGGASLSGHVLGGVDIQLYKQLFLTTEGRYVWASGELNNEFVGFEPLDLSSLRISAGINFVF
jgi:opacity protein-like surface antigen